MPKWLLVLACVLAAPQAAAQANFQPWNAGQQRFSVGDYASAYEIWLPEAKAGDPRAQYSLGVLYERGHGVPRDLVTAAKWYALSARQEYAPAVTALRALAPKLKEMLGDQEHDGPPLPKVKPAGNGKSAAAEPGWPAGAVAALRERLGAFAALTVGAAEPTGDEAARLYDLRIELVGAALTIAALDVRRIESGLLLAGIGPAAFAASAGTPPVAIAADSLAGHLDETGLTLRWANPVFAAADAQPVRAAALQLAVADGGVSVVAQAPALHDQAAHAAAVRLQASFAGEELAGVRIEADGLETAAGAIEAAALTVDRDPGDASLALSYRHRGFGAGDVALLPGEVEARLTLHPAPGPTTAAALAWAAMQAVLTGGAGDWFALADGLGRQAAAQGARVELEHLRLGPAGRALHLAGWLQARAEGALPVTGELRLKADGDSPDSGPRGNRMLANLIEIGEAQPDGWTLFRLTENAAGRPALNGRDLTPLLKILGRWLDLQTQVAHAD